MLVKHWQIKAANHQTFSGGGLDELGFSSIAEVVLKCAFEPVHLKESGTAGPKILSLMQNVECAVILHEQLRLLLGSDLNSPTLTSVKCCLWDRIVPYG